ncbi:MAG: hypothetical protein ACM4D3_14330 [Candidatus Sericytochromatia bacterium]
MAGPYYSESSPSHPPTAAASVYPGMLPPPVPYPSGSRWRVVAVILLILVILGGATTAVVYGLTAEKHTVAVGGDITEASAKAAIQSYLDAMERGDTETVARNTQCGFYDEIKDKRADQALARLTSETFRKQFSRADVTSIDKMVFMSPSQAQVLFSMQVTPASRGGKERQEQAIAQVLSADDRLLVCQYLLRSAGQY